MLVVTPGLLKAMNHGVSVPDADVVAVKLNRALAAFDGTAPLRALHLLAQVGHESRFQPVEESLNYSASRLVQVFPSRFPSLAVATAYAHRPEAIGARAYSYKNGNGSEDSGEGYTYRGRGYLQLTGKNNYSYYGELIGYDLLHNPDYCLQHGISALVAAAYFQDRRIWKYADSDNIIEVTRRVNGHALLHLNDRKARLEAGKNYLRG